MANTPNFALYKPSRADTSVEVDTSLSDNFTKIDTELKNNKDGLDTHKNDPNAHTSENVSHADGSVKSTLENHEERIGGLETDTEDLETRVNDIETLGLDVLAPNLEGRIQTIESDVEGFLAPATFDAMDQQSYTFDEYRVGYVENKLNPISSSLAGQGINIMYPPAPLVGAKGDGSDETAVINAIFASVPVGGTLIVPTGYEFTVSQITLNTAEVTVTGGGTIRGSLFIGAKIGGQNKLRVKVDNITFEQGFLTSGTTGIELGKVRVATITRCLFKDIDKAIYVAPDQNYGFHDIAQIKIFQNQFQDVNFNVYVKNYNDYATNTDRWMTCSDWQYVDNISNLTFITPIYIEAIDGINISNNTFFHSATAVVRDLKRQGIYIGQSDWVNIVNNHVFETGWEGIQLDSPKHFIVSDNEMAWCGDLEPRSSILITGTSKMTGTVANNIISLFTKHGVEVNSTGTGSITVKNNTMDFNALSSVYFGSTLLSSIQHYTVFDNNNTTMSIDSAGNFCSDDNIIEYLKGGATSSYRGNYISGFSTTYRANSVTGANTPVFNCSSYRGSTATYDGLITVTVKNVTGDTGNLASYVLHVVKSSASMVITTVSSLGMTAGSSANWPSFTFTVDSATDAIRATPVSLTSGMFHFYATYSGNLKLK